MSTSPRTASDSTRTGIEQRPALLTARRREILDLVAKGLTNEEIARILSLSAGTIRIQLSNILADLQVANRTEATAVYLAWKARSESITEVLSRPAIAIAPFTAHSDDPSAVRTAAAISEDLAMLFARWCWFPVLRASEAPKPASDVTPSRDGKSDELEARFVVSGSLRTSASQWRINVRVDDTQENRVLWTERFDIAAEELFAAQDAICQSIVGTSYEIFIRGITARVAPAQHPLTVDAWSIAHEGMFRHSSRSATNNGQAQTLFHHAIEREPNLVLAHYGLGLCHYDSVLNQWSDANPESLLVCAQRCIDLAPHSAEGFYLLGRHHQVRGRHHDAIAPLELAIARNPSFSPAHALLAQVLVLTGRPDEGLDRMRHARRLAPRAYVAGLATLHFLREEYELALTHCESAIAAHPTYPYGFALAAASAHLLGRDELAQTMVRSLKSLQPDYSSKRFLRTFGAGFSGVERLAFALSALGVER